MLILYNTILLLIVSKIKLMTLVKGDPKAPFSIATTPRCRGGRYSFPGLLHFTLDAYLIMLSVKQGGIKYHFFKSLVWLNLGLNPDLPGHWWTLYLLGQWHFTIINTIQLLVGWFYRCQLLLSYFMPKLV